MQSFLFIAMGGAVGAILRFLMSQTLIKAFGTTFPWATMMVNITGCFIIGLLWGLCSLFETENNAKLFIFTGLLGSFTTFSTFAIENFHFIRNGDLPLVALNVSISNIFGILLVFVGFYFSKILASVFKLC